MLCVVVKVLEKVTFNIRNEKVFKENLSQNVFQHLLMMQKLLYALGRIITENYYRMFSEYETPSTALMKKN